MTNTKKISLVTGPLLVVGVLALPPVREYISLFAEFSGIRGTTGTVTESTPPLVLLSSHSYESSESFTRVEGEVRNQSGRSLEVIAVVRWFAPSGQLVMTDEALTTFNPLAAGETSSFSTISRGHFSSGHTYTVAFRTFGGQRLNAEDLSSNRRGDTR